MDDMQKARTSIVLRHPWWAAVALKLDSVPVEEGDPRNPMGTLATDGQHVYYSEEFFTGLDPEERIGVLVHEALHCAFLHHLRRGQRDALKWNVAADYAINNILVECGVCLPKGALVDAQFDGMSAEEIYDRLPQGDGQQPQDWVSDGPGDATQRDAQARQWQEALASSMHAAKRAGKLSGNAEAQLEKMLNPPLPWADILAHLLRQAVGKDDFSWHRPSRRGLAWGMALPGHLGTSCPPIGVAIDTSGSMSAAELSHAVEQVRAIAEHLRCEAVRVVEADVSVQKEHELLTGDIFEPPALHGGGGTSFVHALKALDDAQVAAIVYCTDMAGEFPPKAPRAPVFWVTQTTGEAPFGTVIRVQK